MGNEFSGAKQKDFDKLETGNDMEEVEEEDEDKNTFSYDSTTEEEEEMGEDEADTEDTDKLKIFIHTLRQKNGDMKRKLRSYRDRIIELERNEKIMNRSMKKYTQEKIKKLEDSKKDLERKMNKIETQKHVESTLFENVEKLAKEKERLESEIHNTKLDRIKSYRFQSKRANIIREFFFTEKNYVDCLILLRTEYLKPLATNKIMNRKKYEKMVIFKAFDTIFDLNRIFLTRLEETVFAQERDELLVDLVISFCDSFKLYSDYIKHFGTSQKVFNEQLEKNKKLVKFLDEKAQELRTRFEMKGEKGVKDVNIHGLLITPIQRLPRYLLLLKDLYKYTRKTSERYRKLGDVIVRLEKIISFCNESSKVYEDSLKLIDLSKKLNITLIQKRFILEKKVMRVNSAKKLRPSILYLFNDLLVVHQIKGGILDKLKKSGQNKQWSIHFLEKDASQGASKYFKKGIPDESLGNGEVMLIEVEGYQNDIKIVWKSKFDQKEFFSKMNQLRKEEGLSLFNIE